MAKIPDEMMRLNLTVNGDVARKEMGELARSTQDLTAKSKELKSELKKLDKESDDYGKRCKEINSELKANSSAIKTNKERYAKLSSELKVTSMTTEELQRRQYSLRTVMGKTLPGTAEWKKLQKDLGAVTIRLAQLRREAYSTEGAVCKMASGINKYFGMVTGAVASAIMYTSYLHKSVQSYSALDEAMADVMKTTGMTREEVEALNIELDKIDTRVAQNELLSIARIAGKLGIAKEDIEGFTRAANIIKVALGGDLGDDAEQTMGQMGKIVDVFKLKGEFGMEDAMLKGASSINDLGKASTANEANIVDFMRRISGVAPAAKLSFQDMAGLGATLDAAGQTMEVSGTAMSQVITKMYQNTSAFAAAAQMDVKDFEKIMSEDMNAALIKVFEGLSQLDQAGRTKVVSELGVDGTRCTGVLGSLADNVENLKTQQLISNRAFEAGTSCLEEYNIKNNTTEAITEKLKKKIELQSTALGKDLVPAYHQTLSVQASLIAISRTLIGWFIKSKGAILSLVAAYVTYRGIIALANIVTKANIALQKIWLPIKAAHLLATRATTIATVTQTGATVGATYATRMLAIAIKASPWGWLAAGIGATVGVLAIFYTNVTKSTTAQKVFNDVNERASQIEDEHGKSIVGKAEKMRQLMRVIEDTATAEDRRNNAIVELQGLIPNGINLINQETIANGKAAESVAEYTDQLVLQARLKAAIRLREAKMDEYAEKTLPGEDSHGEQPWYFSVTGRIAAFATPGLTYKDLLASVTEQDKARAKQQLDDEVAEYDEIISNIQTELDSKQIVVPAGKWSLDTDEVHMQERQNLKQKYLNGEIKDEQKYNEELLKLDIKTLQDRLQTTVEGSAERMKIQAQLTEKLLEQKRNKTTPTGSDSDKDWSLSNDSKYANDKLKLRMQFNQGEIATEKEYKDRLLQLELDSLNARLAANIEAGDDRVKLQTELTDKQLEQKNRVQQQQNAAESLRIANITDATEREVEEYKRRQVQYAGNAAALVQLELQHNRNIARIELKRATDVLKIEEDQYKQGRQALLNRHKFELQTADLTKRERAQKKIEQNNQLNDYDEQYMNSAIARLRSLSGQGILSFEDLKGVLQTIDLDTEFLSEEEKASLLKRIKELEIAMANAVEQVEDLGYSFSNGKGNLFGFSQDDWELFFENLKNGKLGGDDLTFALSAGLNAASMAMGVYADYDKMVSAKENAQLHKDKKNNDKKKKNLENRLDGGLMTQAQYDAEVERMDADMAAKEEQMQIKQAKRQKQMSITNAIINTASGVVKTLSEWGLPWGLIPAGIMAAMGAAQIAMISATPIASGYEKGGLVQRSQDGKLFNANHTPKARGLIKDTAFLVSENGPEYVLPSEALQNPTAAPLINMFEAVRQKGQLRDFDFNQVMPAMMIGKGYSMGGYTAPTQISNISHSTTSNVSFDVLTDVLSKLSQQLDKPIKADVTMMGRNGILEKQAEHSRMVKRSNFGKV